MNNLSKDAETEIKDIVEKYNVIINVNCNMITNSNESINK